jgi:hypothetical protein
MIRAVAHANRTSPIMIRDRKTFSVSIPTVVQHEQVPQNICDPANCHVYRPHARRRVDQNPMPGLHLPV